MQAHTYDTDDRLDNEQELGPDDIREGQLVRVHWVRSYNRYVRSQRAMNLIATVVDTLEKGSHWQLLVGDHLYGLVHCPRPDGAIPQWRIYEDNPRKRQITAHDAYAVYGEVACH